MRWNRLKYEPETAGTAAGDDVIFAPEGFIGQHYLPALESRDVTIIEIRTLADGLCFTARRHHHS